jgi:hypothetical protein
MYQIIAHKAHGIIEVAEAHIPARDLAAALLYVRDLNEFLTPVVYTVEREEAS